MALRITLDRLRAWLKSAGNKISARWHSRQTNAAKTEDLDHQLVRSLAKKRWPAPEQLKYLNELLSPRERRWAVFFLVVLLGSVLALSVRFYKRHVVFLPRGGGNYTEVVTGNPQYINPIISQGNDVDQDLVQLMYSSLYRVGAGPNPEPDLVAAQNISEDGKVYTLTLRDNVKWHDGENLTAEDVLFTFELIQQKEFNSPLRNTFKNVVAEKTDDRTVKFTLKEPFGPFLSQLTFGILPEHIWRDVPPTNLTLVEQNLKPIGSGPFRFSKLVRASSGTIKSYTLERNDSYYGKKPYLSELVFRFVADIDSALSMLESDKAEGLSFIPTADLPKLKKETNARVVNLHLPQYVAVFLNQNVKLFQKKEVRQALAAATDRPSIADLIGPAEVAEGPINHQALGYSPDVKMPAFNPQQAGELLDAAGWKFADGSTVRKNGDAKLAFTLTTVDQPDYVQVANALKDQWAKAGIEVTVNAVDPGTATRDVLRPRKYDALLYGEISSFDPDLYPFWHSSQERDPGLNLAIFYRKDMDKVLETARATTDPQARAAKYVEFQKLLMDELPAIFLYSPYYHYVLPKKIHGFTTEWLITPRDRFNDVTEWYTRVKRGWQ